MADKAPLMYIPGGSEEARSANQAYEEALKRLTESLDARKNRFFDPTLLAMAEGFLAPTKTGSFFESAGMAARGYRQAQEEEAKIEQELAKQQLMLAERGLGLQQQKERERQFQDALSAAFADKPPAGMEMAVGVQVFPPSAELVSSKQLLMQRYREGKMSLGDALAEAAKMERERYSMEQGLIFDKLAGKVYVVPTGDVVEVDTSVGPRRVPKSIVALATSMRNPQIIEDYAKKLMSPEDVEGLKTKSRRGAEIAFEEWVVRNINGEEYRIPKALAVEYDKAVTQFGPNSPQARAVLAPFFGATRSATTTATAPESPAIPGVVRGAEGAPAGGATAPTVEPTERPGEPKLGVLSERQRAERDLASKLDVEGLAKWNNDKRTELLGKSSEAQEDMRIARQLEILARSKYANQIFGMLSDPSVAAAFAKLAESGAGITLPGGARATIGIPNLEQILVNLSIPKEAQADARVALQLMRQLQLRQSSLMKGAPSNFEQGLAAEANINPSDTPQTVVRKAQMVVARGQFDRDVAEFMRKTSITPYRLPDTDWYKNRLLQLDQTLFDLQKGGKLVPVSNVPRPSGVDSDWTLKMDAKGNKAWVSPDGKKAVEVK